IYRFFIENPAQNSEIIGTILNLPYYIRERANTIEAYLLADMIQIAIDRWYILISKDDDFFALNNDIKSKNISHIFLKKTHKIIIPTKQIDVFNAWVDCDEAQEGQQLTPIKYCKKNKKGILLYKISPIQLKYIEIKQEFINFIKFLSQGYSIEEAIDHGISEEETISENDFNLFLENLTINNAFIS
ncbi:MAG: hypothetical protein K2X39_10475, partial [Silvanigrellaceae bacterium]|nr:hypothetical protein [Silvanigrellaceae bacterium]